MGDARPLADAAAKMNMAGAPLNAEKSTTEVRTAAEKHAATEPAPAEKGADGAPSFAEYVRRRLPLVEEALERAAAAPLTEGGVAGDLSRYLYDPLARFTAGGGKRVRPVLCLLGAEAVGGEPERALSAAVAVELFQSAALIHDDIADSGELRRGEPCLHRAIGEGLAINAGDLALTQVFEVVLGAGALDAATKLRVLGELAAMERRTLEGQALDLGWVRDGRWDVRTDGYLYMVTSKTAWYTCASPLYLGAVAAGASEQTACGLVEVGLHAGIAFQLQDDLLNLVGDAEAQGKDFRSDITEGKRTLAVVSALEHLDGEKRAELVELLASGTGNPGELARAVELVEAGGGIGTCRELACAEAEDAQANALALVQEGAITPEAGELLCSMADFFVERLS